MGKSIGIDFGTTTTEVSYVNAKNRVCVARIAGEETVATVLYFNSEDEYIIGNKADKKSKIHPEASVRNFKTFLTDPTKRYNVTAENGDEFVIKPRKAAELFLHELIKYVQPKLTKEFGLEEGEIDKAVITVPAQFDPEEKASVKNALINAAENVGLSNIKIAAEPTAAAVAYQDENGEDGEIILVYDFGGGTFDVSVIKKDGERYTEIATDGDKHLGGNILTEKTARVLWKKCLEEVDRDYPYEQEDADEYEEEDYDLNKNRYLQNRSEVFMTAEEMKKRFSEEDDVEEVINFYYDNDEDPKMINVHLTEEEFSDIIREDIDKTVELTNRVLEETMRKENIPEVDAVVLAGGSSQIRLVQELLFKGDSLSKHEISAGDAIALISRGAALLASVELKVEECTRFEIGTRVISGNHFDAYECIIPMGEKLPCSGSHTYYLTRDGQKEVTIAYYEKDVKNYPDASRIDDDGINMVNELTITGIPDIKNAALKVTFNIEIDGTPTISAEVIDADGNMVKAEKLVITKGENIF